MNNYTKILAAQIIIEQANQLVDSVEICTEDYLMCFQTQYKPFHVSCWRRDEDSGCSAEIEVLEGMSLNVICKGEYSDEVICEMAELLLKRLGAEE